MGATVMLVMCGYTCERLFGYRNALVERVSIEISKAKTKKDARLELEMTRPVTAAASTSLRSFRTYLLVVPAQGTGLDPGWPALAAATLEAANGMTSHSKTCYADIVKCLARRWPRDAEFSKASGDFANAHDGRRSIHNRPARPPPEILAPCWIKPKRQSTSGAVRGREASLAP
jgi:hypothetical protein